MKKLINLILYSNLYIALCAVAMTVQTLCILKLDSVVYLSLLLFVFCTTLVVYALHRVLSINKVPKGTGGMRFQLIASGKHSLLILSLIAIIVGAASFFYLKHSTQLLILPAALVSIGYIVPLFGPTRLRLRDFHYVKIVLIALTWSFVTVLLPLIEANIAFSGEFVCMFFERFLFIFIITLPFDIRDIEIDKGSSVKTIPLTIGIRNTVFLAVFCLFVWAVTIILVYPSDFWLPFMLSALATAIMLIKAPTQKHDYFYTAGIDGLMLLQCFLVVILC